MNDVFQELMTDLGNKSEATENSGMENQETTETTNEVAQESNSGMEGEQSQVQEQVQPPAENQQQQVDYVGWLKDKSQGYFNNEEELISSLDKLKGYEELSKQKEALEQNQLPDDQFLKTLASLRTKGANAEQIKEFIKINTEYEDLSTLTPKELKVAKMVLVDGYSKKVAEYEIDKQFGLNNLDEESDNYELEKASAEESLRLSSNKDLDALESYKAKLTTVDTAKLEEQSKLQQQSIMSAHIATVKESIPLIQNNFTGVGSASLKETVNGEEVVSEVSIDYDEDFKKEVPLMLERFFSEKLEPITQESMANAKEYIDAIYWKQNGVKLMEQSFKNGIALGLEKADNKYVNPNGLKEVSEQNVPKESALAAEWAEFEKRVAKW